MKISYNWLKQYVDTDLPVERVAEILTDTGLEVGGLEKYQSIQGGLEGLVVGKVLSAEPHPDADRLRVTSVDIGADEPLGIVCGAPNVAAGQKVVVATVGAKLYPEGGDPFEIKKAKIRGVASTGMICAEDEIGLGQSHDGIMVLEDAVQVGTPASEVFEVVNDEIIEIDITPNRSDALSHYGVARDLVAALKYQGTGATLKAPEVKKLDATECPVEVIVQDQQGAPRYAGAVIRGVKVADSPEWLQQALLSIGLNPINNVVDITNYVLHELGHPLHAFDLKEVGDKVVVRRAVAQEPFTTLDDIERKLDPADLLIANATKGMCLAGVLGGAVSGVTESTTDVFLESAYFNPVSIRKSARRHALNTDASFRFERGADVDVVPVALARAARLIEEVAGGKIDGGMTDVYPAPIPEKQISFDLDFSDRLIGQAIPEDGVRGILTDLGISIVSEKDRTWQLSVPNFKEDVTRPVDVVEEILRIHGYNNVEIPAHSKAAIPVEKADRGRVLKSQMAAELAALGCNEIMSNSLESESLYNHHDDATKNELVKVLNPLSSELNIMRRSGVYSGLEAIRFNANRQQKRLQLFEFGFTYAKQEDGYEERPYLGIFISGERQPENWGMAAAKSDFFTLKGLVSHVLTKAGVKVDKLRESVNASPYGKETLSLGLGKSVLADIVQVDKKLASKLEIDQPVYAAIIYWDTLIQMTGKPNKFTPLPKFPAVRRDLALLVGEQVSYLDIQQVVKKFTGEQMRGVNLFDVYTGKNLPEGKKSYAISVTFRDDNATLTDKKVDKVMAKVIAGLQNEVGAELR